MHQYYEFCKSINYQPCVLILFVSHLAQKCCHSMICSYLSAVQYIHIVHGETPPRAAIKGLEQQPREDPYDYLS